MDLSVIVPCHNLENFITPLLFSIDVQRIGAYSIELIFVCDSCTDKTEEVIKNYKFTNPQIKRISVYPIEVHSCGLARNLGFCHATGTYIWFMDGDDWLSDHEAIKKVISTLERTNEPLIRFDYEAPGFHAKGIQSMVWQYAYRKDFIEDIKFGSMQPHEDLYFTREVLVKYNNNKIPFINETLYFYNYNREGSNMYQYNRKKRIDP